MVCKAVLDRVDERILGLAFQAGAAAISELGGVIRGIQQSGSVTGSFAVVDAFRHGQAISKAFVGITAGAAADAAIGTQPPIIKQRLAEGELSPVSAGCPQGGRVPGAGPRALRRELRWCTAGERWRIMP
jgi:hypothetical protein